MNFLMAQPNMTSWNAGGKLKIFTVLLKQSTENVLNVIEKELFFSFGLKNLNFQANNYMNFCDYFKIILCV